MDKKIHLFCGLLIGTSMIIQACGGGAPDSTSMAETDPVLQATGDTNPNDIADNIVTELPDEPSNSESVPDGSNEDRVTTVEDVEFDGTVLPDPAPDPTAIDFSDVDPGTLPLALDPISPVEIVPADVNTSLNQAPFFNNLTDVVVYAGQTLNLVMAPKDNDRSVPGVFVSKLPEGAKVEDNFNGTRSIIWKPLQPAVGIYTVTITAQDAIDPGLQTAQKIRIQVVLPDDTSTIPNYPPQLNQVWDHVIRAGDTITMLVKAGDPNGTYGPIEFISEFANSTFEPLTDEPDIYLFKAPTTEQDFGRQELRFRATDAVDNTMSTERSYFIDIKNKDDFIVQGQRLRDLADARDFKIGFASFWGWVNRPDGELYADVARTEFNIVTPENSMKRGFVHPEPNKWSWVDGDRTVQYARDNNMMIHGHTLVWHAYVPQWVSKLKHAARRTEMLEYIRTVVSRYNNDVAIWDVVNEALAEDGSYRNSMWYEAMGPSYIDQAFRQARIYAPDASLLYNDYHVAWEGPKSDGMYELVRGMQERSVPIDGVGFQMHVYAAFDEYDSLRRNFQRFADLDLDIYITEMDVRMLSGDTLEKQANVYRSILQVCLEQPRCKSLQTWGYTDQYTWLGHDASPLLFDREYQAKPAYFALQQELAGS